MVQPLISLDKSRRLLPGARPFGMALAAASLLLVSACSQEQSQNANAGNVPKPQVSVVTLQPQSVSINAEMPGRTTASLVADVRPQVGGIIEQRLFTEGGEVKEGDVLYKIDPASYQAAYDSAAAALQRAEATVPSAQSMVTRYQGLIKQNAVSKQDLDNAIASLAQANADVAAAKAALDTARINLDYTSIKAPIGGRIDRSTLTPGALVTASQDTALTTIRTLDPINVDVTQSSTNLLNLRQAIQDGRIKISGENVSVRLKLETGAIYPLSGKLEFAESAVSETTGTFTLRATFPNPDRLLLPGMFVRALVEEGVAPNSFLVPQRGVTRNAKAENKVEERILEVRQSVGNNWLVSSGVAAGDRVIVEGSQLVRAGQDVEPVDVTVDDTTGEVRERKQAQATEDSATQLAQGQASSAAVKE